MAILPKSIHGANMIVTKTTMVLFTELKKIIQKFTWNHKKICIGTAILNKNKVGSSILPDANLHYKTIVIKTAQH